MSSNRLDSNVLPEHYDLVIKTDLKLKKFIGSSNIELNLLKSTNSIILNVASPLLLKNAVLHSSTTTRDSRQAIKFNEDTIRERVEIMFTGDDVIEKGKYTLSLRWEGELNRSMKGYYLSAYPTKKSSPEEVDSESFYALTQFQPTSSRRAFPSFDDPGMKATYSISMISRVGTTSLSNLPVISTESLGPSSKFPRTNLQTDNFFEYSVIPTGHERVVVAGVDRTETTTTKSSTSTSTTTTTTGGSTTTTTTKTSSSTSSKVTNNSTSTNNSTTESNDDQWEIVHFDESPKMSTYLVAFANGYFEYKESSFTSPLTSLTIPIRFYATWDNINQTELALTTTAKLLPIYETVFNIPYPLSKLDTLVVSDFDLGAMENWGLITGRTSVYLWEEKSGLAAKKRVVSTTSHEISHQWFGNIVSPDYWNQLWLNESFATLIGEVIMIQAYEPSWKAHSSFISDHLNRALNLDSLRSSHPIEIKTDISEAKILSVFDAVSYSKGGSVLKFLSALVGEKVFLAGVTLYLKAHLYGNAKTADLWKGISQACDEAGQPRNIVEMMESWTNKIGFPIITVEEDEEGIKVTQNRFLATGDPTSEEDETIWHVPLELKIVSEDGKSTINHSLLTTRDSRIIIKDVAQSIFKLNAETTGVYRVLYSKARLARLGDEAGKSNSVFSLNDRMGLVQDSSVLASSGYTRTSSSLTLIQKLKNETETLVWSEISSSLANLTATWSNQTEEDKSGLNRLRLNLFKPLVEKLGFEYIDGEDSDVAELRTIAISVASACGDIETLEEYKKRFNLLLEQNDDSRIPSDLRRSIFCRIVESSGDEKEYNKILEIYRNPASPAVKIAAIAGLSSAQTPALIKRTLDFVLSSEVKNQDFVIFFNYLATNSKTRRDLWNLFKENCDTLVERFTGNFVIGRIIEASFSSLSTVEDLEEITKFFSSKDTSGYLPSLQQGLDSVRANVAWLGRDIEDVHIWLENNQFLA